MLELGLNQRGLNQCVTYVNGRQPKIWGNPTDYRRIKHLASVIYTENKNNQRNMQWAVQKLRNLISAILPPPPM